MSETTSKSANDPTLFKKIQQDRDFLESVFDRIPGMIYIHDLVNDVNLYRSGTLQKLLGREESEGMKVGKKIRSWIHPDDMDDFKRASRGLQLAKDNEGIPLNYRMRHKNGKWLWFRSEEYVYERDANGNPTKCLGYATDLTSTIEQQNELDKLNKDNQFLLKAAQILSQPDRKYKVALQELAQNVSLYFGVVCDISILDSESDVIRPEAVFHPDKAVREIIVQLFGQRTVRRGEGLVGSVIETGKEVLFNEVPEEMRQGPRRVDKRIVPRSMLYVPLRGVNGVLGSLNVTRLEGQDKFTDFHLKGLRRLGDYVSLFVNNALLKEEQQKIIDSWQQAEKELRESSNWAEFKVEVSTLLADVDSNLSSILQGFTERIAVYFDVVCDIQLVTDDGENIELAAFHHENPLVKEALESTLSRHLIKVGEGMVGSVVETGNEFFAYELPEDLRKRTIDDKWNPLIIPKSFIYTPLKSHGRILGTLDLTRLSHQHPISEVELDKIRNLAEHAAMFIENRLLHAQQKKEIKRRKRAENKLEKTTQVLAQIEAETRKILNAIPIYIARISKDLRYLFLNETYRQRGMNPRTSEGKNVVDMIGPQELDKLMVHVEKVLKGNLVNYEYESTMNDGVHRYFNVVLAPDFSADGSVVGFYSCSIDMTTKILAEQTAKRTEDRLEALSLNSGDAFFFHDLDQNILDVNQVATEMLGYSREEFLTMNADQIDPVWKGNLYQKFLKTMDVNAPQTFDTTVIRKDGSEMPVEVRFVKRVEGKREYLQSLIRDRTYKRDQELKLQQSEERMRLILENVEDIITVHDEEGIFESVNKATQGNTEEGMIGTSVFDLYDEKKALEIRIKYERLKKTGKPFVHQESYVGPDGSTILYWTKFLAVFHDRQFFKAIAITRDVTAERSHERSVMNAVLKGQEQERKRLGAELHDGIGQVLSAIALQVSQVREEVLDNDVKSFTEDLSSLNDNLQEAIREVRNISHDLMPEVLESFGLKEAVNQICSNIHDRSGIDIVFDHVDLDSRYDELIEVNLFRIAQELLNNIQKHASCNKVFVSLIDHGKSLNLTVEDDGIGFNVEGASSGIGLSNVISRVSSMNGQIDIESAENSGTLVNIDVPKNAHEQS